MTPLFIVPLLCILLMACLTWQRPEALFSLARMIDRSSTCLVRELLIRARAKRDAEECLKRALAWHRGRLSTTETPAAIQ